MSIAEQIALVERYILDRKGVAVTINTPDTPMRVHLLVMAVNVAQHWYDTR